MRLTPALLAACYTLLRETPPFCRWRLPPSDQLRFVVVDEARVFGKCHAYWTKRRFLQTRRFRISISEATINTLDRLMRQMAHEMIHVRQGVTASSGVECERTMHHGDDFLAMEQQIVKAHCWDYPL